MIKEKLRDLWAGQGGDDAEINAVWSTLITADVLHVNRCCCAACQCVLLLLLLHVCAYGGLQVLISCDVEGR